MRSSFRSEVPGMQNLFGKVIRNEHSLPNARAELERLWKERMAKNKDIQGAEGGPVEDEEEDDELPMIND